jgi:hypothetical protein
VATVQTETVRTRVSQGPEEEGLVVVAMEQQEQMASTPLEEQAELLMGEMVVVRTSGRPESQVINPEQVAPEARMLISPEATALLG